MLERPSNALVERCSKKYKNDARYSYADEIQRRLTTKFAGDYESILLAVVFLNQIYSTNLYDVYRVADHIYKKKDMILPAIETGKIEAVEMIATGHGIGRKGCKESVFYSFSTKFCNYLNPKAYPIFDSHVEKMLKVVKIGGNVVDNPEKLDAFYAISPYWRARKSSCTAAAKSPRPSEKRSESRLR